MQLPPRDIKEFNRVPIPKHVAGETRPLAITNDLLRFARKMILRAALSLLFFTAVQW